MNTINHSADDILPSFPRIRQQNLDVLYGTGSNSSTDNADSNNISNISKDKSRMGHVDPHIVDLVNYINHCTSSTYVTLSSCSGRIVIFQPSSSTNTTATPIEASSSTSSITNLPAKSSGNMSHDHVNDSMTLDDQETGHVHKNSTSTAAAIGTDSEETTKTIYDSSFNSSHDGKTSGKGQTGSKWLYVSHDVVADPNCSIVPLFFSRSGHNNIDESNDVIVDHDKLGTTVVPTEPVICYLKFEPMLLHVAACNVVAGQFLLQWALQNGLRESGLVITSERVTVALRTHSLSLSIPLSCDTNHIFFPKSKEYVIALITECNRRLALNLKLIGKLLQSIQRLNFTALSISSTGTSRLFTDTDNATTTSNKVYNSLMISSNESIQVTISTPKNSTPIPSLDLYGHAAIDLVWFTNENADDATTKIIKREILVFGGYGHGPSILRTNDMLPSLLPHQKQKARSPFIYRLQGQQSVASTEPVRWMNSWEAVNTALTDDPTKLNISSTLHTSPQSHELDGDCSNQLSLTFDVQPTVWDGRLYSTVINLSNALRYSSNDCCSDVDKSIILLFGGRYGPYKPMNDILLFEYFSNTNGKMYVPKDIRGTVPTPRWGHTLTALNNHRKEMNDSITTSNCTIPIGLLIGGRSTCDVNEDACYILSIARCSTNSSQYHFVWEQVIVNNDNLLRRFFHTSTSLVGDTNLIVFVYGGLSQPESLLDAFEQNDKSNSCNQAISLTWTSRDFKNYLEPHLAPVTTNISSRFGHAATCSIVSGSDTHTSTDNSGIIVFIGGINMNTSISSSSSGDDTEISIPDQPNSSKWMECIGFAVSHGKLSCHSVQLSILYKDDDNIIAPVYDPGVQIHHNCIPLFRPSDSTENNPLLEVLLIGGGVSGFAFQPVFSPSHYLSMEWKHKDLSGYSDRRSILNSKADQSSIRNTAEMRSVSSTKSINSANDHGVPVPICHVVYVRKQNAKLIKTQLENMQRIDMRYRLTAVEKDGIVVWGNCKESGLEALTTQYLLNFIAVPILPQCIDSLKEMCTFSSEDDFSHSSIKVDKPFLNCSLIVGYGKQTCFESTREFARGRNARVG